MNDSDVCRNQVECERVSAIEIKKDFIHSKSREVKEYEVVWYHLSYIVTNSWWKRKLASIQGIKDVPKSKLIIKDVNGHFKSGELVAIMGPSGAGKSTLLESLIGEKLSGREGRIVCTSEADLSIAYVPQHDRLYENLTVMESLVYAARLKLTTKYLEEEKELATGLQVDDLKTLDRKKQSYFKKKASELIDKLGLEVCADNRISVCSGGQLKRLSIAQELITKPNILILDEPTTGLDSNTCLMLMEYLKNLLDSTTTLSIVTTIHQPSYRVFSSFHRLYVLSRNGKCIYEGNPVVMADYLNQFDLECPQYYNPADFVAEVATGDYGEEAIDKLSEAHSEQFKNMIEKHNLEKLNDLHQMMKQRNFPFFDHFVILIERSLMLNVRNPWLFGLKFAVNLTIALFICFLYGTEVGKTSGCPPNFDQEFDPSQLEWLQKYAKAQVDAIINNCGNLFFSLVFILFVGTFVNVLTFPSECQVFVKEEHNAWYGIRTFFLAKTISEIPFLIFFTSLYTTITYLWLNQVMQIGRLLAYIFVHVLFSYYCESQGMLVGAIAMNFVTAGVYCAPLSVCPMVLFSGFFMKLSQIPYLYVPLIYMFPMNYAYDALIILIFGFNRCGIESQRSVTKMRESLSGWFSDALGVDTGNGNYTSTGVTMGFVNNVVDFVFGDYISEDGKVQSMAFNLFERSDNLFLIDIAVIMFM
ncbi:ABC transporter sub-family G-like protein 1, partial [Dinothrombium tinctorium]